MLMREARMVFGLGAFVIGLIYLKEKFYGVEFYKTCLSINIVANPYPGGFRQNRLYANVLEGQVTRQ